MSQHEEILILDNQGLPVPLGPAQYCFQGAPSPAEISKAFDHAKAGQAICEVIADFLARLLPTLDPDRGKQLLPHFVNFVNGTVILSLRDPARLPEQYRQNQLCMNSWQAIRLFLGYDLQPHCEQVYGVDSTKWPALLEALVVKQLEGRADWQGADLPIAWVKARTGGIHDEDHMQGGAIREIDALYCNQNSETPRDVVPLESISDLGGAAEMVVRPNYASRVADLVSAAADDADLTAFLELRLAGWRPRPAWERLGWDATRGRAVDKQYRRLRDRLKATGFEHQSRDIEVGPGASDASCTVLKERLRFPVHPMSEATLSGRVVYSPLPSEPTD